MCFAVVSTDRVVHSVTCRTENPVSARVAASRFELPAALPLHPGHDENVLGWIMTTNSSHNNNMTILLLYYINNMTIIQQNIITFSSSSSFSFFSSPFFFIQLYFQLIWDRDSLKRLPLIPALNKYNNYRK